MKSRLITLWAGIAWAGTAATVALLTPSSALASGDVLHAAITTATPEQSIPVTVSFSGETEADENNGNGPRLYAVVRPAGGVSCQRSYGADKAAAGGVNHDLVYYNSEGPGSFEDLVSYAPPNVGEYLVCAWLENENEEALAGPASATFSAREPQVEQLTVNLASPAKPGVGFQIDYTTQTDQELTLRSTIKPSGGLPCASSYELGQHQNQSQEDIFIFGTNVFGGPATVSGTATEQNAGPYLVCSWVEGPNEGEVDASSTTPVYVGIPPLPATKKLSPQARQCASAEATAARLRHEYDSLTSRAHRAHGRRRARLAHAAARARSAWSRARAHTRAACARTG
jgi:hypothetical protein